MNQDVSRTVDPNATGWQLLKSWNFGFLYSGQVVSQIGDALNKVALLWFVYELTGSALKMALIGLLQTIPPLVFGPLIGVYLDRLPKKQVMVWVDLIRAVMIALIPIMYAQDALSLDRLYVLVFLTSIVSTVFGPALSAAVPLLVSEKQLTSANALIQSTFNIGILLGPAASGVGIALIGAQNVLYVNAATFLISALCLMPMHLQETIPVSQRLLDLRALKQDLLVGFRFVFLQQRTVAVLMVTATLYSLGASAFVFILPVFATQLLGVGPVELGWLWSSLGVGMLAASVWLARRKQLNDLHNRMRIISRSMAIGGIAVCGLSVLETPLLATILILVIGGCTALFTPVVWALLQEITPRHMLGRVFTTFSTGAMSSAMAGMAGFGWAADKVGPDASLVGIGLILLGTAIVASRLGPRCAVAPVSRAA